MVAGSIVSLIWFEGHQVEECLSRFASWLDQLWSQNHPLHSLPTVHQALSLLKNRLKRRCLTSAQPTRSLRFPSSWRRLSKPLFSPSIISIFQRTETGEVSVFQSFLVSYHCWMVARITIYDVCLKLCTNLSRFLSSTVLSFLSHRLMGC